MIVKQLYTNCLSEAAYFIASDKEAAIIDPMRDVEQYLALEEEYGVRIKYIFETHFHADFVSGHLELSEKTGAPIVFGPGTHTHFVIHEGEDGELFRIGKLSLKLIHTPGHTLESSCFLLSDSNDKPYCIFTGDTLFVGDVGRPDLSSGNLGKEELASYLFNSLQKLKQLPDDVIVYPAHGPGTACGKKLSKETHSTIGEQKKSNYAMKATDKTAFIKDITAGLEEPPSYFKEDARINREGYESLDKILTNSDRAFTPEEFKRELQKDVWILDTRESKVFAEGFIPGSINIGLQGRFAEWAGQLLPFNQPVVLVTRKGDEKETIIRLARIGFQNVRGYLAGGFDAWKEANEKTDMLINVDVEELMLDIPYDKNLRIIDVRKSSEFADEHIEGALNIPLNEMMDPLKLAGIEEEHNLYVHCKSGYRSSIACSLIKRQGFHNLRNIPGGFNAIQECKDIPIVTSDYTKVS